MSVCVRHKDTERQPNRTNDSSDGSTYTTNTSPHEKRHVNFLYLETLGQGQGLCHTYLLTYPMAQSPSSEANWFAASQEIPRVLWNPKAHHRTHKTPPPVPILGQLNPVHISTSHLPEIHPNIIHLSKPRSPQWSLSLRFPYQDAIRPLSSPIRATCPVHLILLDVITREISGEEYRSFNS